MSIIGNRIKECRENLGLTQEQLAQKLGYKSKTTINKIEKGINDITQSKVKAFADVLNTTPAYLMGWDEDNKSSHITVTSIGDTSRPRKKGVVINVLGRVAAGVPIEAIEEVIDTEEITEEMAKTGKFFGLQIHGDSMIPNICDGDIVIVRQQEDAETGDIVIATVNGTDATCKRLRKYKDGIELIANNPTYEPLDFSNQAIIEKPVRIIGKVVELRRKF